MVGSTDGAEPQGGDLPLSVLPTAAAVADGARAGAARGRHPPAPARAYGVRARGEARGTAAFEGSVALRTAAQAQPVLAPVRPDSNPMTPCNDPNKLLRCAST